MQACDDTEGCVFANVYQDQHPAGEIPRDLPPSARPAKVPAGRAHVRTRLQVPWRRLFRQLRRVERPKLHHRVVGLLQIGQPLIAQGHFTRFLTFDHFSRAYS
ncbi:hypothetical protein K437DRAFT_6888 [Tilletiaria anomala UBC 951]|uniref:Uncharacterized protein n=1 Tax=Tilletiaria anomala (strain ATCC 24038 / CBS 436.72 / UBC 951) TaxID=1037660 RepID=A0A066WNA6_TILAU|nr:uncharacterized protein K437DRAFT_6888 [Tilletiaria anomala UBC 951]KDN52469.1 hypothetical protein K437DRAFT_6888 [Tilletiaria anomala UBC 951]